MQWFSMAMLSSILSDRLEFRIAFCPKLYGIVDWLEFGIVFCPKLHGIVDCQVDCDCNGDDIVYALFFFIAQMYQSDSELALWIAM